jgi:hypothetical protein
VTLCFASNGNKRQPNCSHTSVKGLLWGEHKFQGIWSKVFVGYY